VNALPAVPPGPDTTGREPVLAFVAARERLVDAVFGAMRPSGIKDWDAIDAAAVALVESRKRFYAACEQASQHVNFPAAAGCEETPDA
jgi:hypothetical protein